MKWLLVPLLTGLALAANIQDEQVVRNTYAKLAYAVQSRTVYDEAGKEPSLTLSELSKKLQANELRFDITEMSSGALSEIASRPYSDFVTPPDRQPVLSVVFDTQIVNEGKGQLFTSHFATLHWVPSSYDPGGAGARVWDTPMKDALAGAGERAFTRYVTATITAHFQGQSRTYHSLWLFGPTTEVRAIDLVTGNSILTGFTKESAYPSVLTDTSLRSHPAVDGWLKSTQRFDASCKTGKQDVCCDSAMQCGVNSEDLRSTKPAPTTKAVPKGGL